MKKIYFLKFSLLVFIIFTFYKPVLAWDDKITHKDLSKYAADLSILRLCNNDQDQNCNYLKTLGLNKGLLEIIEWNGNSTIKKGKVEDWLREGEELEDASSFGFPILPSSTTRSFNHFHNPLKDWTQAGLNDLWTGESSLLWAQDRTSQQNIVEGDQTWQQAKYYFYLSLMSTTNLLRQENFAKMFRGLGHQMHLLQDTAVPDHVRNDAHPEDAIFGKVNINIYFESWAKSEQQRIIDLASDPNLYISLEVSLNISRNGLAPVTQLFDAEEYNGTNPSASFAQGLSEYTNANFFSGDTIFAAERYSVDNGHYFPYPKISSTDLQNYLTETKPEETIVAEDGDTDTGIWISKIADGENIEHIVRTGKLTKWYYKFLGESALFYSTFYRDEKCHEDYAEKLIPRAVGYSAGLLDYFFRGSIEIMLPDTGVYAVTNDPNQGFTNVTLLVKNTTPNNEQMNDGSIELIVKYRLAQSDPFHSVPPPVSEEIYYIVVPETNGIRSIPRDNPAELTFDLSQTPIPLFATDVYLQIVYHGRLGMEDNAVAVGFKDISEPTPVEEFNNMDKICINGQWYVAGSQEAYDALPESAKWWDYFPHDLEDEYVKISPIGSPVDASPTEYTFYNPLIEAGALYWAFILSDYEFEYSGYGAMSPTDTRDTNDHTLAIKRVTAQGAGVRNQEEYITEQSICSSYGLPAPCTVRRTSLFYTFRGVDMWGPGSFITDGVSYPDHTDPGYIPCSWDDLDE